MPSIISISSDELSPTLDTSSLFEHKDLQRNRIGHTFDLYPLSCLNELISKLPIQKGAIDFLDDNPRIIRFLVDGDNQLWFAKEGRPGKHVPAHLQMSTSKTCRTAGNMEFNNEGKLIMINHKSGDFQPSFQSLSWLFAILSQSKLDMLVGNELCVERLISTRAPREIYNASKKDFIALCKKIHDYGDNKLINLTQTETSTKTCKVKELNRLSSRAMSPRRGQHDNTPVPSSSCASFFSEVNSPSRNAEVNDSSKKRKERDGENLGFKQIKRLNMGIQP